MAGGGLQKLPLKREKEDGSPVNGQTGGGEKKANKVLGLHIGPGRRSRIAELNKLNVRAKELSTSRRENGRDA